MILVEAIKEDRKIEQAFVHYYDAKEFAIRREKEGYSVIMYNHPDVNTHEELAEKLFNSGQKRPREV